MDLLEKSKSDKQSEKNMEGENSDPSRQTEVSESDNHEKDNTGNECPGPSRQTSASCNDKRKYNLRKRKMESSSSNLEKKIKRSRIETDASRIEEDAIVNEQFSCKHCEAKFSSTGGVRKHSAKIHKDKYQPHTCYECNIRFKSRSVLHYHDKRNHKKKEYECEICGKQFWTKTKLRNHIMTHNTERNFVCDFCPKTFKTKNNCHMHMKIHTRKEGDKYECDVCGKHFLYKGSLKRHKQTEHPEEDSPTNEQRDHSLEEIDAERTTHENERNFVCDFCPKAFKDIYYRNAHMKIHTRKEEDKFECDVCGKRFGRKSNLKRHKQKKHPEEDSPRNEQRGQNFEESDAKLSPSRVGSTFGQDLQRRQKVDLEEQENDSQESKRVMLDEIAEHENEPKVQNFIHSKNETIEREQSSQSDKEYSQKSRQDISQDDETKPVLNNQPCEDDYWNDLFGGQILRYPDFIDLKNLYE